MMVSILPDSSLGLSGIQYPGAMPCGTKMPVKRVGRDRRGLAQRRLRRNHRIEQRQRQRHARAAQKRPPGYVLLGDEHCFRSLL